MESYIKKIKPLGVFDGSKSQFPYWKNDCKNFIQLYTHASEDLWALMLSSGIANEGTNPAVTARAENHKLLKAILLTKTDADTRLYISQCNDKPLQQWSQIIQKYEGSTIVSQLLIQKEIEKISFNECIGVADFFYKLGSCFERLRAAGDAMSDTAKIACIMKKVPNKYGSIIDNLIIIQGTIPTQQQLMQLLILNEARSANEDTIDAVASSGNSSSTAMRAEKARFHGRCFNCKRKGHKKSDCYLRGGGKFVDPGNDATANIAFTATSGSSSGNNFCFIVDSGASHHMSPHEHLFTNVEPLSSSLTIKFADGKLHNVIGKGNIIGNCVTSSGTITVTISALLVPDLEANLLSVSKLHENGVEFSTEMYPHLKIRSSSATIKLQEQPYRLTFETIELYSGEANLAIPMQQLHQRLGHQNDNTCKRVAKLNKLVISTTSTRPCDSCAIGKSKALPYPKATKNPATEKLEAVHIDFVGPIAPATDQGHKHILFFIDYFSKAMVAFTAARKSEAPDLLRSYLLQFGIPQTIRRDNAPELSSAEVDEMLKLYSIKSELSVPYSSQQNGLVERHIATIISMMRTVLQWSKLGLKYWRFALQWCIYTKNRTIAKGMTATPHELFTTVKSNISLLRTFGCVVYVHIPKLLRGGKLQPTAWRGIMMGYAPHSKGYMIMNPINGKLFVRRNVVFNELTPGGTLFASQIPTTLLTVPTNFEQVAQPVVLNQLDVDANVETNNPSVSTGVVNSTNDTATTKEIKFPPGWWMAKAAQAASTPATFVEATSSRHINNWLPSMKAELEAIEENDTFEVNPVVPSGVKVVDSKWIYKTKLQADGTVASYKSRIVAKGFSQIEGLNYSNTYAPVSSSSSFRMVTCIAAHRQLRLNHVDAKSAFTNAAGTEEIFMKLPAGITLVNGSLCVEPNCSGKRIIVRLRKSLYGLKQAPFNWNQLLSNFLVENTGLIQSPHEPCLFTNNDCSVIVLVYVDDLVLATTTQVKADDFVKQFKSKFKISHFEQISSHIGINVEVDNDCVIIHQESYINKLIEKFNIDESKQVATPMIERLLSKQDEIISSPVDPTKYQEIIGSLVYASTTTRPDIALATSVLGRFAAKPFKIHYTAARRVLQYLASTKKYGIKYCVASNLVLECHVDSDWAGDPSSRKSTSGYLFTLGSGPIAWRSCKQKCVALSSAEAEYVAASEAAKEAIYLRNVLSSLNCEQLQPTVMFEDSESCIQLSKQPLRKNRLKHVELRYHFIRDAIKKHHVQFQWISSKEQPADLLTKPLGRVKFNKFRNSLLVLVPPSVSQEV